MGLPSKFAGWLTINRACNLRCEWCYAKNTKFSNDLDMRLDIARLAIKVFSELPLKDVVVIGGEPTIHPNFFEILQLLREKNLNAYLVTNSLKFSDENFLKKTLDIGLAGINTSLKAGTEEDYKKFTGRAVLGQTMKAIANINKLEIYHKISVTICKSLFNKFDSILDVVARSKSPMLSLDFGRPFILGEEVYADGIGTPKEMADFIVRIYPKIVDSGIRFNIKILMPFCLFPEGFIEMLMENGHMVSGCQIFNGKGIIFDSMGKLLPCNHFCDNPLASLGNDFSSGSEYLTFRKKPSIIAFYEKISSCPHKRCVDCEKWSLCGAGCRVNWMYYTSNSLIGNNKKGGDSPER